MAPVKRDHNITKNEKSEYSWELDERTTATIEFIDGLVLQWIRICWLDKYFQIQVNKKLSIIMLNETGNMPLLTWMIWTWQKCQNG